MSWGYFMPTELITKKETEELRNLIKVIEAFLAGKVIQFYNNGIWVDISSPTFDCTYRWRIKPREPIRFWGAVKLNDNKFPYYVHNDRGIVVNWISRMTEYAVIEFIEVISPNENP